MRQEYGKGKLKYKQIDKHNEKGSDYKNIGNNIIKVIIVKL
jgi:hypothetical protein